MRNKKIIFSSLVLVGLLAGGAVWQLTRSSATTGAKPVVTTVAQAEILARLGVAVAGVPSTTETLPAADRDLPKVGNHTSINFEQISKINPSVVYVDQAVADDYTAKLKQQHTPMHILNFNDYAHMRQSITQLGATYQQQGAAEKLLHQITLPKTHTVKGVKVLILMGMPGGAFLVANQHSYVGDLVTRAGGTVVAGDPNSMYAPANPQTIAQLNPDVVIRFAHAMPVSVQANFVETFKQAPYNNLAATRHHHVYDAAAPEFGLTANLHVKAAYTQIQKWLEAAK